MVPLPQRIMLAGQIRSEEEPMTTTHEEKIASIMNRVPSVERY